MYTGKEEHENKNSIETEIEIEIQESSVLELHMTNCDGPVASCTNHKYMLLQYSIVCF